MFTGLIEGTGKVTKLQETAEGKRICIHYPFVDTPGIGDSIAINGVCLTVEVVDAEKKEAEFYASYKTLELTTLGLLEQDANVNLERALLPTTRMGGHIVQGHVDGVAKVLLVESKEDGNVIRYQLEAPQALVPYIVERGSIAVDGISLTVVGIEEACFELVIIPETIRKTSVSTWQVGSKVNLETDIMARYIEKLMKR
ncbi:MAG: riboflavin synthase [Spirochaetota bacterium]